MIDLTIFSVVHSDEGVICVIWLFVSVQKSF